MPVQQSEYTYPTSAQRTPLDLVLAFFTAKNPQTLLAYRNDLEDFQAFLGVASLPLMVEKFTSHGAGHANGLSLGYLGHLKARGLAPATLNRRLSTLSSFCKLAGVLGFINWKLEVFKVRSSSYRDTRGPGMAGFNAMMERLDGKVSPKAFRDSAMLRLMFNMGLRRGEVLSLDRSHLDLEAGHLTIMGKGTNERETLSIPPKALASLKAWVNLRGNSAGPLFTALDFNNHGHRLDGSTLYRLVGKLGMSVGLAGVRPHGLRHASITAALDQTNGDLRKVQKFSRHKNPATLILYDDARQDFAGQVSCLVDL
jgi:integrase/recombinase XerC